MTLKKEFILIENLNVNYFYKITIENVWEEGSNTLFSKIQSADTVQKMKNV